MSIYKDNITGKWRVVYRYNDWTGKTKQTSKRGFPTKREAQMWEHEQMLKHDAKLDMTFASFYEIYVEDKKERIRDNTWGTKGHIARTKILPYFGERKIAEIEPRDIIAWQNHLSNLHRQWGYVTEDVGKRKTICLSKRLRDMNESVKIQEIKSFIREDTLEKINLGKVDLIIDCADKPTVDQTAVWIGEYCMKRNIPHIIAGGYNLHVSLIGQTIIPYKIACVKCFEKQLRRHNELELSNMKKLATPGRKIGSIGPMCSLSASFASLEAIKVLSKLIPPSNINRRGEFNIYNMEIQYHEYNEIEECEW